MELRTSLEDEPITRPITMSTQPSETVAAQGLSKVRAGDDEGLAAGGLAERQRRALQKGLSIVKQASKLRRILP